MRNGPPTTQIITLLSAAILFASGATRTAAAAEDLPAFFYITRTTTLTRSVVAFLKDVVEHGDSAAHERLVVLAQDGRVLGESDGSDSEVHVPTVDAAELGDGEGVVLVHTHPSSTSFSRADLQHLSRPGVEAVVAVGEDGSVYFAARGSRFVPNRVGTLYDTAAEAVNSMWRSAGAGRGSVRIEPHHAHLVARGLAESGFIVYQAQLPFHRERSYYDAGILFAMIVEEARCEVTDALH